MIHYIFSYIGRNLDGFIVNYVTALTAFMFGLAPSIFYQANWYIKNARVARCYRPTSQITLFVGSLQSGRRDILSVSRGDYYSVAFLYSFLTRVFRKYEVKLLDVADISALTVASPDTLVLIGGPSTNEYSKEIISALRKRSELPFSYTDSSISVDSECFEITCHDDGSCRETFGVVYKFRNPSNHKQTIIFVAGLTGLGTLAASKVLSESGFYATHRAVIKGDHALFIVKASFIKGVMIDNVIVMSKRL